MTTLNVIKLLSPLIVFAIYVVNLAIFNTDPFIIKWINGSFAFFIALVFTNVIRKDLSNK